MDEKEFKDPTKKFALRVIKLVESLPNDHAADVLGKQLLRWLWLRSKRFALESER